MGLLNWHSRKDFDKDIWGIDALFVLDCGCIMDGCSDSDPGRKWANKQKGVLWCVLHHEWQQLIDVVYIRPPEPLSPARDE
jgi:hypothetical protein